MKQLFLSMMILTLAIGCTQRPAVRDISAEANGGVNIVPNVVLAAQKIGPEQLPIDENRPDLIQALSQSPMSHEDVLRALRATDLVTQLQNEGPFTLLAPTDEAWNKLPPGTLDRLLRPTNHDKLRALMLHHILKGRIELRDMLNTNGQVVTLAGDKVIIRGVGDKVVINDTNVIRAEDGASNGVIVWIDGVLLP
jgi:uncharacterized surface protein with fasciclin (FAS1) repeats